MVTASCAGTRPEPGIDAAYACNLVSRDQAATAKVKVEGEVSVAQVRHEVIDNSPR